jgi:imidazolonepropionase-like amidohydrolase
MAICHALDHKAAALAVDCGVDGLIHVYYDVPSAPAVVKKIVDAKIWVTSTIVTLGALAGELTGENIVNDAHAMADLPEALHGNIQRCWVDHKVEPASTENAVSNIRELHAAGVPILCGTDACGIIGLGAVYGVGFHSELRFLVKAGLSPIEALRSGTSIPADKFSLKDRGRVQVGLNADLLLVDGDPTRNIEDAIKVHSVWRNGALLDREATTNKVKQMVAEKLANQSAK